MKLLLSIFLIGIGGLALAGCEETGGGGGGFVPTGSILAVAEKPGSEVTIEVGGLPGAVPPGSTVEITNLDTGETETSSGQADESFGPVTFTGDTGDEFNVLVTDGGVVEDVVIGVTLLSDSVEQNLAKLGSVPTTIKIRGDRAYVPNGFSDNIQIFDLNQNPPGLVGTIVVPPGSNPFDIAFLDDTRAYVPNFSGQSVAVVNIQTRVCEVLIVEAGHSGSTQGCQQVLIIAGNPFEEPSNIAIANGKVFVANNNFDPNFNPAGNGFITIINSVNNLLITTIEATGANTGSMLVLDGTLYALNSGATIFDPVSNTFTCNPQFPPSIDLINVQTNAIVDTIDIPLSPQNPRVCAPNSFASTSDGFAYTGLSLVGALLKVDLISGDVINGPANPIVFTDTTGLNTGSVAIRDDLLFTTFFNSDQIAVLDTDNDEPNPFPYMAPFPAGIRAFDPDANIFDGVQNLAIRPGIPGVDFEGPDIFFITGISEQLGSVDTTLGLE